MRDDLLGVNMEAAASPWLPRLNVDHEQSRLYSLFSIIILVILRCLRFILYVGKRHGTTRPLHVLRPLQRNRRCWFSSVIARLRIMGFIVCNSAMDYGLLAEVSIAVCSRVSQRIILKLLDHRRNLCSVYPISVSCPLGHLMFRSGWATVGIPVNRQ
jgi:hypothetical protein